MDNVKSYEELTIRDYFMFGKICSQPENRKLIIDSLLQMNLQEKTGEIEKHIQEYKNAKFARLDLLVEDTSGKIYNAEMQNKSKNNSRQKELPKRSRYYQSLLDSSQLKSGESYLKLPETYIIFICTFDPFKKNLPIYSFDTKCNEIDLPEYDDQAHKIYFNTTANLEGLPLAMKNMLEYINTGIVKDSATDTINNAVVEARLKEEWRQEYMLTLTYQNEIFADGIVEGIYQNQLNTIFKKINKNKLLPQIADEMEEDIETIRPLYDIVINNPGKTIEELTAIVNSQQ